MNFMGGIIRGEYIFVLMLIAALNTPFRKSPMVKVKQRVQPFDDKILLTLIQTSRRKTKYKHVQKSTWRDIKFPEKDLKVENLKLKRN